MVILPSNLSTKRLNTEYGAYKTMERTGGSVISSAPKNHFQQNTIAPAH